MDERTLPLPLAVFIHRHPADRQYLRQYQHRLDTIMSDTTTVPAHMYRSDVWVDHPGNGNMLSYYLAQDDRTAVAIWEEAHAENERRSTPVSSRADEPETYVREPATAWDLAHAEQTVRNIRAEIGRLSAALTEERTRQISGSDPRLELFWERAGELADEAGHCQVYDQLAEALGGEARRKDYDVTVTYRFSVSLTSSEANDFDLYNYDPCDYDADPDIQIERS